MAIYLNLDKTHATTSGANMLAVIAGLVGKSIVIEAYAHIVATGA